MMLINWEQFTPWSSLAGGALIGAAAAILILLNGRIAGISGVVGGLLRPTSGEISWRVAFVAGLVISPFGYQFIRELPPIQIDASYSMLVVAGLLVGCGTRFGAGCTSGHGVCGLSRFSPRSLVAAPLFMTAGFFTVYLVRHLIGQV